MFLALNEIMKEKSRFILITVVIILVSYLVFFLTALAFGLATSYTTAIDKWAADSIVLSENANNNIGRSLLFGEDYQDLLSEEVAAIGVGTATVEVDESEDVSLFGIDRVRFPSRMAISGMKARVFKPTLMFSSSKVTTAARVTSLAVPDVEGAATKVIFRRASGALPFRISSMVKVLYSHRRVITLAASMAEPPALSTW